MSDRDRLKNILLGGQGDKTYYMTGDAAKHIADHLLSNGVIVPPCKVGDMVYVINDCEVEKTSVFSIKIVSEYNYLVIFVKARVTDYGIKIANEYGYMFKTFVFGKTVFLTREEAEQALKERKEK